MNINIPVSVGELVDRITVLRLKRDRLPGPAQRANARAELDSLEAACEASIGPLDSAPAAVAERVAALAEVNRRLWDVEEALRGFERSGEFGPRFVAAARQVYRLNDERHRIKRELSAAYGSDIIEEKSYPSLRAPCELCAKIRRK